MKTNVFAALTVALAATVSTAAFADSCPQVNASFSADVLRLANEAAQVDTLWDQIADDSDASEEAEDLKDSTREFHGVMFRESCDDLVEEFDEIAEDFQNLRAAIAEDPQLSRRRDVSLAVEKLRRAFVIVSRDVLRLR